jgi:ATP-dependent Clp protease protease subunit
MGRQAAKTTGDSEFGEAPSMGIALAEDRIVFLSGDVTEHSITQVQAQLISLANHSKLPITLVVSTYGGSVDEMFSLYDTIKFIGVPIHTVGLGKIMSAGVLLLAAGAKGKRLIGTHARIMIHPLSGGSGGNVFEMQNDTAEHQRLQELLVKAMLQETKFKRPDLEKLMKSGYDCYLTAQDAIRHGIVDSQI